MLVVADLPATWDIRRRRVRLPTAFAEFSCSGDVLAFNLPVILLRLSLELPTVVPLY